MADTTIQYILPAPFLSLPSVYLIPVTPAPNQVLAWSADGSAIVMRPVTSSMVTDFGSAVGSIVTSSVAALNLGSAASHAATDFATPASVSTAIGALNLGSASTHPASDFATPANITSAITALSLGTASTHPATDFAAASHTQAFSTITGTISLSQVPATLNNPYGYLPLNMAGEAAGIWIPRNGTDADMSMLVGEVGEITISIDSTFIKLRVHDKVTPGGVVMSAGFVGELVNAAINYHDIDADSDKTALFSYGRLKNIADY